MHVFVFSYSASSGPQFEHEVFYLLCLKDSLSSPFFHTYIFTFSSPPSLFFLSLFFPSLSLTLPSSPFTPASPHRMGWSPCMVQCCTSVWMLKARLLALTCSLAWVRTDWPLAWVCSTTRACIWEQPGPTSGSSGWRCWKKYVLYCYIGIIGLNY